MGGGLHEDEEGACTVVFLLVLYRSRCPGYANLECVCAGKEELMAARVDIAQRIYAESRPSPLCVPLWRDSHVTLHPLPLLSMCVGWWSCVCVCVCVCVFA
ncbi:hypothetical protein CRENBAI_015720 [Crenichthys baileyi]|uniref:Uncharacterized protein n=1 Tax=Crenichthys baileyi TaxID=28760 RepID=A0AAV9RR08_9TELE